MSKPRRGRGTGSVIKRGKSWTVVLDLGRKPDGTRDRRWHSGYTTKRAADKDMIDLLARIERGEYVDPNKVTVAEFFEQWLGYKTGRVELETVERYRELLAGYVAPEIGHLKLQKLQPLHLVDLYTKLAQSGRRRGEGGLSPRTLVHVHRAVFGALKQAVRWRVLAVNPATAVEPPKAAGARMVTLDQGQARRLLDVAAGIMRVLVVLAMATGARRGELVALRWADVDLEAGTIRVERARRVTHKHGDRTKDPKSESSKRTVALPAFAVPELKRHRAEQAQARLRLGAAYRTDLDLVIAKADGSPYHPDSLTIAFRKLADELGLPGTVHLHTLRHSCASFLAAEGTSASDIAAVLGHADGGALAMRVYVHPLPEAQQRAAARLERMLGETVEEAQ